MIRSILSLAVLASFAVAAPLQAEPAPKKQSSSKKKTTVKIVPSVPLKLGWSLVNGVWTHSDGYQFVKGQVIRAGTQTHKKPPQPPTKAEMDAAMKKPQGPKTPAQIAADKEAARQRNLRPIPAPQTGFH
ncbi:MAG: hypothetical protein QOD80_423 [Verrucomicrobiota bacterium]